MPRTGSIAPTGLGSSFLLYLGLSPQATRLRPYGAAMSMFEDLRRKLQVFEERWTGKATAPEGRLDVAWGASPR